MRSKRGNIQTKNLAVCHKREELCQDYGTVVASKKDRLLVRNDMGVYRARRAVSCLVDPVIGDLVLFCTADHGSGYILAVLERKEGVAATVSFAGDLNLRLDGGGLGLDIRDGVAITSPHKISMISAALDIQTVTADFTIQQTLLTGNIFQASLKKVKLFAGCLDSLLDRVHQRVKRSYRFVEETDSVRAENIDHRAEKLLNLRGKNAVINARELVKLDGEQIHVG
ncbi:MAG: hypothetical protein CSYNP_03735 [Syntrophus sp. SKADARSKE-3]|nr:hypothetical protein [Syntrophus sp. SKADARSKE-3]